jgi:5-methylcytosine-specific restriction endonuclease McrA
MSYGLSAPVLVLNRSFQPVRVTTARMAFTMMYLGRARALDAGFEPHDFEAWSRFAPAPDEEWIGTTRGKVRVPRVLLLSGYNRVPRAAVRLSRRNVFLRDGYTCQYCGRSPHARELNLDHVMPRSRGGRSSWENLVTSCRDCNLRKGGSTPEECGYLLRRPPVRPTWSAAVQLAASPRRFREWDPFLASATPAAMPIDEVAEE